MHIKGGLAHGRHSGDCAFCLSTEMNSSSSARQPRIELRQFGFTAQRVRACRKRLPPRC